MPVRSELLEEAMKNFWPVGLALAAALAIAPIAKADSYNINISGTDISGTAVITVAANGEITSGTFSFSTLGTASSVSGSLVADTPQTVEYYDADTNSISTTSPSSSKVWNGYSFDDMFALSGNTGNVSDYGILVAVPDGYLNIFADGGSDYWNEYDYVTGTWTPSEVDNDLVALSITRTDPAPEPSSLLMLGTGLLCMAGILFWKARPSLLNAA
jgi:type 1 fimbria pilin